jgi:hypothetical protein
MEEVYALQYVQPISIALSEGYCGRYGNRVMWNLLINRTPTTPRSSDEHGREGCRLTGIMQDGMICAQRSLIVVLDLPTILVTSKGIPLFQRFLFVHQSQAKMAGDLPSRRLKAARSDCFPRAAFS